jgi:hypothetical protein
MAQLAVTVDDLVTVDAIDCRVTVPKLSSDRLVALSMPIEQDEL